MGWATSSECTTVKPALGVAVCSATTESPHQYATSRAGPVVVTCPEVTGPTLGVSATAKSITAVAPRTSSIDSVHSSNTSAAIDSWTW